VTDGERTWTYAEHHDRVRRAAGALRAELGIAPGDRVATLLPNVAAMLELHYAVPAAGGVLVPLNTRLAGPEYAHILRHSGARLVVASTAFREALDGVPVRVLWVEDDYDAAIASAQPAPLARPADERTLRSFYALTRPGGPGWARVVRNAAADGEPLATTGRGWIVPRGIIAMVAGCFTVYCALFGIGYWIYGRYVLAALLTAVAAAGAIYLARTWGRLSGDAAIAA
jgi:hypothetical protein